MSGEILSEDIYKSASGKKAWIVFTNQCDLPYLRILRKGFRHCFVLIHDGKRWISIDPMANYMEVVAHELEADFDLPKWLRAQGHRVVAAPLAEQVSKAAPLMLFTCVEACKRIIGIHNRLIFTPYQLFRYLEKQNGKRESKSLRVLFQFHSTGDFLWEA